ncbi:hypothetical protein P7228_13345 [Altererythrobacter arenosus]|uniref:UrcA family protein n=1 Tax=Altererythrobacter arenosus TaxID=3032592 RepID=A0ABY8FPN9_9SPHN|nr:hypothetical protein [Altererythrobacter sp. CAU 1644]WFL76965.1 hypothetical protein P7228_13345 [Altererythrobacter sp. CAU 1644]
MIELLISSALLLAAAEVAPETTTAADGTGGTTEQVQELQEVKCRYIREVNSRIPSKICRTKGEWARIAREQREANENNRRNGGSLAEYGTIYGAAGSN